MNRYTYTTNTPKLTSIRIPLKIPSDHSSISLSSTLIRSATNKVTIVALLVSISPEFKSLFLNGAVFRETIKKKTAKQQAIVT